jgi:hypothetical protein
MRFDNRIIAVILATASFSAVHSFHLPPHLLHCSQTIVRTNWKGATLTKTIVTARNSDNRSLFARSQRVLSMLQATKNSDIDGTGARGPIILSLALLVVIWLFSIPPEFRRARICTLPVCVENRALCNDCQTITELREGIVGYYRNGGGIQFDFSIDPATVEQNKQTLQKFGL